KNFPLHTSSLFSPDPNLASSFLLQHRFEGPLLLLRQSLRRPVDSQVHSRRLLQEHQPHHRNQDLHRIPLQPRSDYDLEKEPVNQEVEWLGFKMIGELEIFIEESFVSSKSKCRTKSPDESSALSRSF
ncbi:hypothetical protein LINGRAHAP2_LOCUS8315, partial [Linum grandiflorum]